MNHDKQTTFDDLEDQALISQREELRKLIKSNVFTLEEWDSYINLTKALFPDKMRSEVFMRRVYAGEI